MIPGVKFDSFLGIYHVYHGVNFNPHSLKVNNLRRKVFVWLISFSMSVKGNDLHIFDFQTKLCNYNVIHEALAYQK